MITVNETILTVDDLKDKKYLSFSVSANKGLKVGSEAVVIIEIKEDTTDTTTVTTASTSTLDPTATSDPTATPDSTTSPDPTASTTVTTTTIPPVIDLPKFKYESYSYYITSDTIGTIGVVEADYAGNVIYSVVTFIEYLRTRVNIDAYGRLFLANALVPDIYKFNVRVANIDGTKTSTAMVSGYPSHSRAQYRILNFITDRNHRCAGE